MNQEYLIEVEDLKQYFPVRTGFFKTTHLKAVDGVSFSSLYRVSFKCCADS